MRSLYELLHPLGVIAGQQVVDNFSGDSLNERWTTLNRAGTNTFQMNDGIDQGFEIISDTSELDSGVIAFNDINHYSETGSVNISVARLVTSITDQFMFTGFTNDDGTSVDRVGLDTDSSGNTKFLLITTNVSNTTVDTGINLDLIFRLWRTEIQSSLCKLSDESGLLAISTTNLPDTPLQPYFRMGTRVFASRTGRIRYMEAWNT